MGIADMSKRVGAATARRPISARAPARPQRLEHGRAQVQDRLTGLAHVLLDLAPERQELGLLLRRVRRAPPGDRLQLQRDARKALQHRVVNFTAQAGTLGMRGGKLLVQDPRAAMRGAPGGEQERRAAQRVEPAGLPE